MKYRITEAGGWFIVSLSGNAENNEPLRVKYLFQRWLAQRDIRVIVNLKEIEELGVWEVGLLTSFMKEMDQRGGTLRLCYLDPSLKGYFQNDRYAEQFEIYPNLESAMIRIRVKSMDPREQVGELQPDIFQIRGLNGSSHSYVIKGAYLNALIDSGSDHNFPVLERGLLKIGLRVRDIDLVINTHEHCDHIGANRYFQERSLVAAYRLAASKMVLGDYYVTMYRGNDLNEIPMRVHLWLENMTRIDLGNYSLRVFHTPGHTSGCISLLETTSGLLFSADTLFAGGTLSYIAESGSVGDYIDSLNRLRCFHIAAIYPGHGRISTNAAEDIDRALVNAQKLLSTEANQKWNIFFQKEESEGAKVEPPSDA